MAATPKPKPKPTLKGDAAAKKYREQISPKGMAEAEANAKKALEKKYPGMFNNLPKTRTNTIIPGR